MFSKTRIQILALLSLAPLAAACGDDGGNDERPDAAAPGDVDAAPGPDASNPTACFDEATFFKTAAYGNTFGADPQLTAPNQPVPSFQPADGAPVLTGGATPPDDGFFDATATFIGAIGATDWTEGWTSYPTTTTDDDDAAGDVITVTADITADETWETGNTYVLQNKIFVTSDATLTIQPGVIVRGGVDDAALVVTKEGRIEAAGTAAEPIVFTSKNVSGAAAGDWAGVVLLGAAPINVEGGSDSAEGFEGNADLVDYGGTDAAHDCGTLRYVRIEYAGFLISEGNELNGLTVAGCGSDTELDFLQIHRGLDDGVEFFGGTANIKHLLVSFTDDDGLDCDQGWIGKAQFVIVKQDANTGDKGIECDNNNANNDLEPRTKPEIWNLSLIGSNDTVGADTQAGMHLRRGVAGSIHNAIIAYFRSFAVDVDGAVSAAQAEGGSLTIESSYFFQNGGGADWPADFDVDATNGENDCAE
jgi:hypothetical protein